MRTTLTLDPDIAATLREIERRTGTRHKTLVNDALRLGLRELEKDKLTAKKGRYRTEPFDPGPPAVTDFHSVHDMLAFAEGEDFR